MIWVNKPLNKITFSSQGEWAAKLHGLQKADGET